MSSSDTQEPNRKVQLTDEDIDHIRAFQRLDRDEKEVLIKVAKHLGDEDRRKSFYYLIENQIKIGEILAIHAHLSWFGRMFIKAGAIAGVLLGIVGVYRVISGVK